MSWDGETAKGPDGCERAIRSEVTQRNTAAAAAAASACCESPVALASAGAAARDSNLGGAPLNALDRKALDRKAPVWPSLNRARAASGGRIAP